MAGLHAERFGISTLSFRLTNPFGPYDATDPAAAHVAAAFVMRALEPGEVFALRGAHVERDFLYAGDERGERWLTGPEGTPLVLHHTACDHDMHAVVVCSQCDRPLDVREVRAQAGPGYPRKTGAFTPS